MAERLIAALEADIAALKAGKPARDEQHRSRKSRSSPRIYGREAQNFDIRIAKAAPPPCASASVAITAKFREVLQLHARMLTRVKNASRRHDPGHRARSGAHERAHAAPMARVPGYKPQLRRRDDIQQGRLISARSVYDAGQSAG